MKNLPKIRISKRNIENLVTLIVGLIFVILATFIANFIKYHLFNCEL